MKETWVVNSSPIITLAKIGRLDLLLAPDRTLIIPSAVAQEILNGPQADPGRRAIEAGFGGELTPIEVPSAIGEWGLGRGESAVLALAARSGATAIIDDRDARRAANALGVPLLGTLGVILRARAEHRIVAAAPVLRDLRAHGLRINETLIAATLDQAFGEEWLP